MKIDIVTLFPEMFAGPFDESMVRRAIDTKIVELTIHNLRDWATDRHKSVDDKPYGGGPGMVMRVDVIDRAVEELRSTAKKSRVILLSAKGTRYTQAKARELTRLDQLILIAGHYEGVDQRVHDHVADEVLSIGDFVLTGGELPAMIVVDSVVRLLPGVLGDSESLSEESHDRPGYIEYPHYTRPDEYKGWKVPGTLLSGNHAEIIQWRKENEKRNG